jgi:hypothetical protein
MWLMLLRLCTLPVASVASNLTRMIALLSSRQC